MTSSLRDMGGACGITELEQKLRVARGHKVAVLRAPADSPVRLLAARTTPDRADTVIAFATRRVELAWLKAAYTAARDGRVAWVVYPKPGLPGSDLRWEWLIVALRQYGLNVAEEVSINEIWSALRLCPRGPATQDTTEEHLTLSLEDAG